MHGSRTREPSSSPLGSLTFVAEKVVPSNVPNMVTRAYEVEPAVSRQGT